MPLSLPPTAVDHVVEIEQIGPLLYDILKGVDLPEQEKVEDPLRDLLTHVSAQTNIDFRHYKPSTILRRISRRMAVTHNADIRDYADYLRTHPEEVQELIKAFLIKVTGFFRDPEIFAVLKNAFGAVRTTHRAPYALPIHLLCWLLAYSLYKPLIAYTFHRESRCLIGNTALLPALPRVCNTNNPATSPMLAKFLLLD
jgi:hypothetical protein